MNAILANTSESNECKKILLSSSTTDREIKNWLDDRISKGGKKMDEDDDVNNDDDGLDDYELSTVSCFYTSVYFNNLSGLILIMLLYDVYSDK